MALSFAGGVTGTVSYASSQASGSFSSFQAGDLALVLISRGSSSSPTAVPSGWTLLQSHASTYAHWLYYKTLSSTDLNTCTWTWAATAKTLLTASVYRPGSGKYIYFENSGKGTFATGSVTSVGCGSLTTNKPMVVALAAAYNTIIRTYTPPTGFTERIDYGNTNPDFMHEHSDTNNTWVSGTVSPSATLSSTATYAGGFVVSLYEDDLLYYGAVLLYSPVTLTISSASTWVDMNVSSYVGSDCVGVILRVSESMDTSPNIGFRKNGSTDSRTTVIFSSNQTTVVIGVDSNKIFEAYTSSTGAIYVDLLGYIPSGSATFFTNAYDISTTSILSWVDVDISSYVGSNTPVGVICEVQVYGSSSRYYFGIRKNGSSDSSNYRKIYRHDCFSAICGVDSNKIFEQYIESTYVYLYLTGYFINGATFNTNTVNQTVSSINTYQAKSVSGNAPSGVGVIHDILGSNTAQVYWNIYKDSINYECYKGVYAHCWSVSSVDINKQYYIKSSNKSVTFGEIGYLNCYKQSTSIPLNLYTYYYSMLNNT